MFTVQIVSFVCTKHTICTVNIIFTVKPAVTYILQSSRKEQRYRKSNKKTNIRSVRTGIRNELDGRVQKENDGEKKKLQELNYQSPLSLSFDCLLWPTS